jgi:hypothetical protein
MERKYITVGEIGNIAVKECITNPPFKESRFTYWLDGKSSSHFYETADGAFLGALGRKYLGLNSQFDIFAWKMLKEDKP